jgi:hypothetical protein
MSDEGFISRWSRRKTAAKVTPEAGRDPPAADVIPAKAGAQSTPAAAPDESQPQPLPPVESLTPESDFTPFMKPEVDAGTRRQAVKMLFQDPRYNVMDGLDVYIDDYSKPDPLPEGWLEKMTQTARLGEYRDPEKEAAEKEAPQAAEAIAGRPENAEEEQPLADSAGAAPADTPDAGLQPVQVKESPP